MSSAGYQVEVVPDLRRIDMAEWKKVAMAFALSDGRIDTKEVNILREQLFADGRIDRSELEFIAELRKRAKSTVKAFDDLFIDTVKANILADGAISDAEVNWLRKHIYADGKVDDVEKRLMEELKSAAKSTVESFTTLYNEVMK